MNKKLRCAAIALVILAIACGLWFYQRGLDKNPLYPPNTDVAGQWQQVAAFTNFGHTEQTFQWNHDGKQHWIEDYIAYEGRSRHYKERIAEELEFSVPPEQQTIIEARIRAMYVESDEGFQWQPFVDLRVSNAEISIDKNN